MNKRFCVKKKVTSKGCGSFPPLPTWRRRVQALSHHYLIRGQNGFDVIYTCVWFVDHSVIYDPDTSWTQKSAKALTNRSKILWKMNRNRLESNIFQFGRRNKMYSYFKMRLVKLHWTVRIHSHVFRNLDQTQIKCWKHGFSAFNFRLL